VQKTIEGGTNLDTECEILCAAALSSGQTYHKIRINRLCFALPIKLGHCNGDSIGIMHHVHLVTLELMQGLDFFERLGSLRPLSLGTGSL
jgi:hypothetical protein